MKKSRFGLTTKIVLAGAVLSLVAVSTANATHVFDDVPDSKFFAGPVAWAAANGITTGTSPTTFEPDRGVTRGESVTFLKRYDDNIVQPALEARPKIYTARVASGGTLLAGNPGTASSKSGTGSYKVTFPANVVDCIWSATPTASGLLAFLVDTKEIFATVTGATQGFFPVTTDPDRVVVNIFDEDGTPQDWRFDLAAIC